ncbi:MAG TPA: hypothetical protein VJ965_05785 [Anaerolineales bacterium]|nr:hypothetical protein [Anaerolineales bacterium]
MCCFLPVEGERLEGGRNTGFQPGIFRLMKAVNHYSIKPVYRTL